MANPRTVGDGHGSLLQTAAYYNKGSPDPDYRIASHASPAEIDDVIAGLKAAKTTKLRGLPKDTAAKARLMNKVLNAALKCINAGNIPSPSMRATLPTSLVLDAIVERMRSAHRSALAAMPRAPSPPIDDTAWGMELERRRYLEERIPLDSLA